LEAIVILVIEKAVGDRIGALTVDEDVGRYTNTTKASNIVVA
jgi:hypothetical protein